MGEKLADDPGDTQVWTVVAAVGTGGGQGRMGLQGERPVTGPGVTALAPNVRRGWEDPSRCPAWRWALLEALGTHCARVRPSSACPRPLGLAESGCLVTNEVPRGNGASRPRCPATARVRVWVQGGVSRAWAPLPTPAPRPPEPCTLPGYSLPCQAPIRSASNTHELRDSGRQPRPRAARG